MSLNDPLASMFSVIANAERISRKDITIKPINKLMMKILDTLKQEGYVSSYEVTEDSRGNFMHVKLVGMINKCGVVKPRFPVALHEYEKFEKRYLPAKNIGVLIVSTSQGVMTHAQAKEKMLGGRLLAYCY